MEELLKLLGLVDESKKAEAQKLADAVKTKIDELDADITKQEGLKNDAVASRDKIKTQLKEIGKKLDIDIDTGNVTEAIDAIKNSKGVKESEALGIKEKEIETLKTEIETLKTENETVQSTASKQLLSMSLKTEITALLPTHKAKAGATAYITAEVEKRAVFEDGKAVFKNEDGTTLRIGGKDATASDIIEQMKQKEIDSKESLFFDIGVQESGKNGVGGEKAQGDYKV